jgi:hypothetical protein
VEPESPLLEALSRETDRETSLNTRATAVAAAAALVITLAGGVAKQIFSALDGDWVYVAGAFYALALLAVAVSMMTVVLGVLAPKDLPDLALGPVGRKAVTIALLESKGDTSCLEKVAIEALKSAFVRNLDKQIYLRASYLALAGGIVLFSASGLVIVLYRDVAGTNTFSWTTANVVVAAGLALFLLWYWLALRRPTKARDKLLKEDDAERVKDED